MYKKQMTIQRILCLAAIVMSAVVFIYALGIMTDLYDGLYVANNFGVKGAEVYFNMQDFNQHLLIGSIGMILLGAFLFVTNTHVRRRYYVGNFIATAIYAVASVALAIYSHAQILIYKAQYFEVDLEGLQMYASMFPTDIKYTESTFWFDAHYVVFGALIGVAVLLVLNALWKVYLMRAEAKLTAPGMVFEAGDESAVEKDRMRFINNSTSSNLAILGILFNVFYFVSLYQSDVGTYYYKVLIGISIVYNLIFMLAVFLSSEGVKNYKKNYSYALIIIGILQIVRIFIFPLQAHTDTTLIGGETVSIMGNGQFYLSVAFLVTSAVCLIASAAVNLSKCQELSDHLKSLGIEEA